MPFVDGVPVRMYTEERGSCGAVQAAAVWGERAGK